MTGYGRRGRQPDATQARARTVIADPHRSGGPATGGVTRSGGPVAGGVTRSGGPVADRPATGGPARAGRRRVAGGVVVGLAAGLLAGPVPPAAAAPDCAQAGGQVAAPSWAQQVLAPEQVWPFSQGAGVTVAVLGSGVDGDHPQLRGRVEPGYDAVRGSGRADTDCTGQGTRVAGLIVARQAGPSPFAGLAPSARVLPVRVVDDRAFGAAPVDPGVLARGIDWAVDRGARVVAVTVAADRDSAALRTSVRRAVVRGVLVVGASGDRGGDGNPVSYPAGYPEVLAVGAIGPDGRRWPKSQYGPYLDLVAPGVAVTTTQRGSGLVEAADGTALACGFVAAAVALTLAKRGGAPRSELVRLLTVTAVPGADRAEYGHGTVNPYGALNDQLLPQARPAPLPRFRPAVDRPDPALRESRRIALAGAVLALGTVLVICAVALTLPRVRRRRWRAAVAPAPARSAQPTEPGPPVQLFDDPEPGPGR
ncbi:S8 family serine peptidase [Micromonospora sp. RL09-050-HVF-A]|uniref:S8 family serine peptidase n=1 Tax=Micromonospora sp. RL09-050-HVF-A TaxID=1703433 RepID=UPI001C5D7ED9|nr:S8 family serine peptidase [Micromonospora sp. RL09-050-HVF-A]MBW4703048.1 S8 family serine peptidase [Micromonospora sp. RL09-050-HVF-A]